MPGEEDPDFFWASIFPGKFKFLPNRSRIHAGMDLKIFKEDKESSSPC
jgi:hypothetical protein